MYGHAFPSLLFGVEIELLLGSSSSSSGKKKTGKSDGGGSFGSWTALAREVSRRLTAAGIGNHLNEGGGKGAEHYVEWSIVQEVTIPSQPARNLWGIELVSPVYRAAASPTDAGWGPGVLSSHASSPSPYWASDLETIFAALAATPSLVAHPSPHCSTHVHVSSGGGGSGHYQALGADDLAALAKAAMYFEAALDALVPPERRDDPAASGTGTGSGYWCRSNRSSVAMAGRASLGECFAVVDAAVAVAGAAAGVGGDSSPDGSTSSSSGSGGGDHFSSSSSREGAAVEAARVRAVVEAMNLFPASSAYGRAHGKKADFVRGKVFKWDFSRMLSPPRAGFYLLSGGEDGNEVGGGGGGVEVQRKLDTRTVEFRQPPGSLSGAQARGWVALALAFVAGVVWGGFQAVRLGGEEENGDEVAEGAGMEELWAVLMGGAAGLEWEDVGVLEGVLSGSL